MKQVIYMGSAQKDLRKFPSDVQDVMVVALEMAQAGEKHPDAEPMRGFNGGSVLEVSDDYDSDTYRVMYTVRLSQAIYVLHAFKKKSTQGRKTPKRHIDLVKTRLAAAEKLDAQLKAQAASEQKRGGGPR